MENLVLYLEGHDSKAVSASTILREVGDSDRPATATDTVIEAELGHVHGADEALPLRLEGLEPLLGLCSLRDQLSQLGLYDEALFHQCLVDTLEAFLRLTDLIDQRIGLLFVRLQCPLDHFELGADGSFLA